MASLEFFRQKNVNITLCKNFMAKNCQTAFLVYFVLKFNFSINDPFLKPIWS